MWRNDVAALHLGMWQNVACRPLINGIMACGVACGMWRVAVAVLAVAACGVWRVAVWQ
jgi:hypothetical protein